RDAAARIGPEMGVVDSAPAQAAGRAFARHLICCDQEAETPFVATVRDKAEICAARQRSLERRHRHGVDVVPAHQGYRFGFENARAVQLAAIEQHAHETTIVVRGRGKTATADWLWYGESGLRRLQFDG